MPRVEGKRFTAKVSGINAILGITVPTDVILDILNRLQFEVKLEADGDTMQVVAPRWREDIEVGEPDLAEEVIREYGYEHIVPTFLKGCHRHHRRPDRRAESAGQGQAHHVCPGLLRGRDAGLLRRR